MTTGRKPAKDVRQQILDAAIVLMRQSGLSGAGINQILAKSGAPKGSMYYYFPRGKNEIASKALVTYSERTGTSFDQVMAGEDKPAGKIRALFRAVASRLAAADFGQSCAAGAVALDLDADSAELGPTIAAAFGSWREIVARHLSTGDRAKSESFAGLVLSTIEGAYIRGRAERSTLPFREAGEWLARLAERELE